MKVALRNHVSWWHSQFLKIRTFIEIVIALILDASLILSVWGIRKLVILIIGVDPITIQDLQLYWVVRASEVSTIVLLFLYIISDILRHLLKTYEEVKKDLFKNISPRTVQTSKTKL